MQEHNTSSTPGVPADVDAAVRNAVDAMRLAVQMAGEHIKAQHDEAIGLNDVAEYDRLVAAAPDRWLKLARDSLESGAMFLDRSLRQPTNF